MKSVPLHNFKVFESVARPGSLAAAALEWHVTIGAVSQLLLSADGSVFSAVPVSRVVGSPING
jgi:LysR family glycine cleavage system transcriptional activator